MAPDALGHLEVWLVCRQPAHVRRRAALRPSRRTRRRSPPLSTRPPRFPCASSDKRGRDDARVDPRRDRSRRARARTCIGVIAWMHTFSPAKMWIAGLGALQRPFLHLHTQYNRDLPWAEIDMDFMNLNQSAHGDREFAFMETRMGLVRKTVVGHWTRAARPRADRRLGARRLRLARGAVARGSRGSATTCARSRSPRATRSRRRSGSASR